MSNLPGFDFANHVIKTWSNTALNQARVLNDAWRNIEGGNYGLNDLIADSAKMYRSHYDACRGVATFGVKSVEWRQISLQPGSALSVYFDIPLNLQSSDLRVSRADRTGGPPAAGSVHTLPSANSPSGQFGVDVLADPNAAQGDQWLAFVFDKVSGGSPIGVVLVLVE